MIILTISGKTYEVRETLKEDGFRWNPERKVWSKRFEDTDAEYVENLRNSKWHDFSTTVTKTTEAQAPEKRYPVKESLIFNLESIHDKLWCITDDLRKGVLQYPVEIAGKLCKDEDDVDAIADEADRLCWIAKTRMVTGKEYGRIKKICGWRVMARYATCVASGMSEADAGLCFTDL